MFFRLTGDARNGLAPRSFFDKTTNPAHHQREKARTSAHRRGKGADMAGEPTNEQLWHSVLTGDHPDMRRGRRLYRLIPSNPRCKMCNAPFGVPGALYMRLRGRGPSNLNPRFCNF
jgi:adenylate cyclase